MGIRDSGRPEIGQGGCIGTAADRGDDHHAQGQYSDQGVCSGGGEVCLSCFGQMGDMQCLAIVCLYTIIFFWGCGSLGIV